MSDNLRSLLACSRINSLTIEQEADKLVGQWEALGINENLEGTGAREIPENPGLE